jgi:hypothetical protein
MKIKLPDGTHQVTVETRIVNDGVPLTVAVIDGQIAGIHMIALPRGFRIGKRVSLTNPEFIGWIIEEACSPKMRAGCVYRKKWNKSQKSRRGLINPCDDCAHGYGREDEIDEKETSGYDG